jgi:outer membrane receptor protein involved in Fe transport
VLGGQGFRGDTSLVRTLIDNYDVRWEWYPNPGELVSIALFAKNHDRPIERVEVPTSGTSVLSYINAASAQNLGVEFEFRKELGNIAWALEPLSVFGNVTLMSSEIRLGETGSASVTRSERPLAGQAPYVINAGITYSAASGETSATALFNRVGKRITAAGPLPLPDVYEMPRNVVDVALRFPLPAGISARMDFRNILDAPAVHRQGAVTRMYYTTGRSLTFGLGWKP